MDWSIECSDQIDPGRINLEPYPIFFVVISDSNTTKISWSATTLPWSIIVSWSSEKLFVFNDWTKNYTNAPSNFVKTKNSLFLLKNPNSPLGYGRFSDPCFKVLWEGGVELNILISWGIRNKKVYKVKNFQVRAPHDNFE